MLFTAPLFFPFFVFLLLFFELLWMLLLSRKAFQSAVLLMMDQDVITWAVKKDVETQLEQRRQQPTTPFMRKQPPFLLKVSGISTAAVATRKRRREGFDTASPPHERHGWIAQSVLAGLDAALASLNEDGPTTASIDGLRLRHCGLEALHLDCTPNAGEAGKPFTLRKLLHRPPSIFTAIATLDLESNRLGDRGVAVLTNAVLPHLPHLRHLLLASNGISAVGLGHLSDGVAAADTTISRQLETIGLTNNPLGASEMPYGEPDDSENGVASEETASLTPTASRQLGTLLAALVRHFAGSIRRVHLNHVGLTTGDAVELVRELFRISVASRLFDMAYLRENSGMDCTALLQELQRSCGGDDDSDSVARFYGAHLLV